MLAELRGGRTDGAGRGRELRHDARDLERLALKFGEQKINLHEWGREFTPRAHVAVPGSLDLCLISSIALEEVVRRLDGANVKIIEGPVGKTGARGAIRSVYVRDPDLNLVEISVYNK